MKLFISWSGDRTKKVAEAFNEWIAQLIQATEPWISPNIDKGKSWNEEIKNALGQSKVGIICLDKDNLDSNWILFEAGAIAKTDDAHACTFLLDVKPSDIEPPLGNFQHTIFEKEDIRKLVHTINDKVKSVGEKSIDAGNLNSLFDSLYPSLEAKLKEIQKMPTAKKNVQRPERDILEEILQLVRAMRRNDLLEDVLEDTIPTVPSIFRNRKQKYSRLLRAYIDKDINHPHPDSLTSPFALSYPEFIKAINENRIVQKDGKPYVIIEPIDNTVKD